MCEVHLDTPLSDGDLATLTALQPDSTSPGFAAIEKAILSLPYREREIMRLLHGFGDGYTYTYSEVARIFKMREPRIKDLEARTIETLKTDPSLKDAFRCGGIEPDHTCARDLIETARELTPHLINYLKTHEADLIKLPWSVFEQLVAEFFASWGFEEVRLVGRNSETAADVFAVEKLAKTGVRIRYFIEVKRWKQRVGVEVIDRVYGAMLAERPRWGWHVAMIVSAVGFTAMEKYTTKDLARMGIELRSREDVVGWLRDYKFGDGGLWLPERIVLSPSSRTLAS